MDRNIKQLLYGVIYLTIIFLVVYFSFYKPTLEKVASCFDNTQNQGEEAVDCGGPCVPCGESSLNPITISSNVDVFYLDPGALSIIARVSNNNENYNAGFYYVMNLYNEEGGVIRSVSSEEYIYSSDFKYIILNDSIDQKPFRAEVVIEEVDWEEETSNPKPDLTVQDLSIKLSDDGQRIVASGSVVNKNTVSNFNADVYLLLKNRFGFNVFPVRSQVLGIQSLSQKDFEVSIPAYSSLLDLVDFERSEVIVKSDD